MKTALAHEESTNAEISASLHIDPADQPLVGKEAKFYFHFEKENGSFDVQQCNCLISIFKDGTLVEEHKVKDVESVDQPLLRKTFSESGDYDLSLSGTPNGGAEFEPFDLKYQFHVGTTPSTGLGHYLQHHFVNEHFGHLLIFGGGFIAAIVLLVRNHIENRKKAIRKNSEKN
jgi:hypothetical protein